VSEWVSEWACKLTRTNAWLLELLLGEFSVVHQWVIVTSRKCHTMNSQLVSNSGGLWPFICWKNGLVLSPFFSLWHCPSPSLFQPQKCPCISCQHRKLLLRSVQLIICHFSLWDFQLCNVQRCSFSTVISCWAELPCRTQSLKCQLYRHSMHFKLRLLDGSKQSYQGAVLVQAECPGLSEASILKGMYADL
jgi:hypothetical protein